MTEPHQLNVPKPAGPMGEAPEPTGYAVTCPHHGQVHLTQAEYFHQLGREGQPWSCPHAVTEPAEEIGICGAPSTFDDELYDRTFDRDFDDPEATPTHI